jgi:Tol biopolymer transport system component
MNADGTGLTQLTANVDLDDEEPAFSPDGNQIAFERSGAQLSNPEGDPEVFTMNADGSGEINVTNNGSGVIDGRPDWQPEPNQSPVANDDAFSVKEDQTLTLDPPGVLLNDNDPEGDPLTASLVTGPANGTLTLNPDGSFTYEPNRNFNGTDSFAYKVSDGADESNTATATITVEPVKDKNKKNKHKKKGKGKKGKGKGGGGGGISQGS